ncbi:phage tail protein [Flavobacterium sp.]|uniref:phage tail protein n=1 Tax=Flavobacterium sp. TaxID=239 RepID=UPI0026099E35|nr:phage tail protein [Flavobacterium sp.]
MKTKTQNVITKLFSLVTFCFLLSANAQAPNKFSFQAVVRNTSNQLIVNQQVGVRISLLSVVMGTENTEYVETHTILTNANGLLSLKVGDGTLVSGEFTTAMSSNASSKKIKCEIDPTGGTNYTIISNEQMLSVPYALQSNKASTASFAENVDGVGIKYYILVNGIYPSNNVIGADTVGAIVAHVGNFPNANAGFLPCDGRSMSIANNQALFTIIGTTYGGNGITNFNLPNLNGKVLKGY